MPTPRRRAVKARRVLAARPDRPGAGFDAMVAADTPAARKIAAIRGGVRARVVDDMVRYLDVPKTVIFGLLHTPESTAHKLIKEGRALDAGASERVVRVADVARLAEATFGDRATAAQWLKTDNLALGGDSPLSMLDTEPGAAEVRRLLSAIDHGGVF